MFDLSLRTKKYRDRELDRLGNSENYSVKFSSADGSTNHLGISELELEKIKEILVR